MEDELRDVEGLDPDSLSSALNLTNVGMGEDTPEQKDAMRSLETLLALVEDGSTVCCGAPAWRICPTSSSCAR